MLSAETTDEMLVDEENYGEVYHHHTKNCTNIDTDGICRFVKHTGSCMSEKSQMLKRNYRIHLKNIIKKHPNVQNSEIIRISLHDEKIHSIHNDMESHNIDISKEKKVISRLRNSRK